MTPTLPVPEHWHAEVVKHLLWAVHTAHQHEPDPVTRDLTLRFLLDGITERWDA